MRFIISLAVVVASLAIGAGCIEPSYVPGATCFSSFECPPPPVETDDPVSTFPEQCVPTGANTTVCVPQPFTRPRTTCVDGNNASCLAAGFPVEVQCGPDPDGNPNTDFICQCPELETTCVWDAEACTCSNAPVPIG